MDQIKRIKRSEALAVIAAFFAKSKRSAIAGDALRPGNVD
jgi:hypothetical protein